MVVDEKFYVGYSDINKELKISNTALLKIFENMACIHGSMAGESIKTSKYRWFLTAYHVKVLNRPDYETYITARTWSREIRGVSACREFEIYDENGKLCVIAESNWARINIETGKLDRASPDVIAAYGGEKERTNFGSAWIEKLKEPDDFAFEKEISPARMFIDVNDHMNNVCYLEVADMILPDDVYNAPESDEFEIMYRRAVKYGEEIICRYSDTENGIFVTLKDKENDLRAIIKLKK